MRTKLLLISILFLGLILINTERTDADLVAERRQRDNTFSATTLSFSNRNTANFNVVNWFFTTDHLQPNGYDLHALRVQKDGEMEFNYDIRVINTNKDILCDSLELTVLKDFQEVYKGALSATHIERSISKEGFDDLIFIVKLKSNEASLRQKQCNFTFSMKTYKNNPDEKEGGLWARQELQNSVKTGMW